MRPVLETVWNQLHLFHNVMASLRYLKVMERKWLETLLYISVIYQVLQMRSVQLLLFFLPP